LFKLHQTTKVTKGIILKHLSYLSKFKMIPQESSHKMKIFDFHKT